MHVESNNAEDEILVNVYGCLMFTASVMLIFYIGLSLTGYYPVVQSLRDDVAFDAFENLQAKVGGLEVYLFYVGLQCVMLALLVAAKVLYSDIALFVMLGISAVACT